MAATRRSLATEADPLATMEDYAAQEYQAWPEDAGGDLASLSKFLPRCAEDYNLIVMALAVMKKDHLQNAAVVAEAPEELMIEFARGLIDMSERYGQLEQLLRSAHLRVLAGLARHRAAG